VPGSGWNDELDTGVVMTKFMKSLLAALLLAPLAMAAGFDLVIEPATGGPGEFAAQEIRREAEAKGTAARISLTVAKDGKTPTRPNTPPRSVTSATRWATGNHERALFSGIRSGILHVDRERLVGTP
jgi:hypothetical protein